MWFQKKEQKKIFDKEIYRPVIRSSICTGEQAAGFYNCKTKKFEEVMLIENNKDLEIFLKEYNVNPSELKKEW